MKANAHFDLPVIDWKMYRLFLRELFLPLSVAIAMIVYFQEIPKVNIQIKTEY